LPGPGGSQPGDLYVEIDVEEDPRFERDGADLVVRANVTFSDAALGADYDVPSLERDAEGNEKRIAIAVPPGTQPGSVLTLKGQGIPRLDGRGRGNLVVVVQVTVPKLLSERARKLLAELDGELRSGDAAESRQRAASAK
jgi:molecular chaperone DnaJ